MGGEALDTNSPPGRNDSVTVRANSGEVIGTTA